MNDAETRAELIDPGLNEPVNETLRMGNRMTEKNDSPIVIYETADQVVEVRLDTGQETVWLSLQQLADIFGRDKSVISRHLKNIFTNKELERSSVVAKNATTAEGSSVVRQASRAGI